MEYFRAPLATLDVIPLSGNEVFLRLAMGEARRRAQDGLPPKNKKNLGKYDSPRIVSWLPITEKQRTQFIDLSIRGGWIGIGILAVIWIVVRIIGPTAGWWVPADFS